MTLWVMHHTPINTCDTLKHILITTISDPDGDCCHHKDLKESTLYYQQLRHQRVKKGLVGKLDEMFFINHVRGNEDITEYFNHW